MACRGILAGLIFALLCTVNAQTTPEQIHTSYTTPNTITVTWVAQNDSMFSTLKYSSSASLSGAISVGANMKIFNDFPDDRVFYIYHATTGVLALNSTYFYQVGSAAGGWSSILTFKSVPGLNVPVRFAVYADFGYDNHQSLDALLNETAAGRFDMVLHVGDIGYDMEDNSSLTGDLFLNMMQPIASAIPYQTCPGNHEADHLDLFYNYRSRFNMPGTAEGMYYSFDLGYAHYVAISTEAFFYAPQMYSWLQRDLAAANANRANIPWIIVYGHRPMYCTDNDIYLIESGSAPSTNQSNPWYGDCTSGANYVRNGIEGFFSLEKALYTYGVDVYLCGHEHSYERLFPVYQDEVQKGGNISLGVYESPTASVHIVTGAAGNREDLDGFGPLAAWSAVRSSSYGYGHLDVINATHIHWEQPNHGPFAKPRA